MVLGLGFILLLERGPGREHIAIQSYMLALVAALGALYALALAVEPLRDFFELDPARPAASSSSRCSPPAAGWCWRAPSGACPAIERLEEEVPGGRRSPTPGADARADARPDRSRR